MKKYENENQILQDYEKGLLNEWEKNVHIGRLGKNSEYFTNEDLMCMYCEHLYTCDNIDNGNMKKECAKNLKNI